MITTFRLFEHQQDPEIYQLRDIFDEVPDESELLWNFVSLDDYLNDRYEALDVPIDQIITDKFIQTYNDHAKSWQRRYVKELMNKFKSGYTPEPVIIDTLDNSDPIVIDGNHRLMALHNNGVHTVKVIALDSPL